MAKYTEDQIEEILSRYKDSEQSKLIFARQEKISVNTLCKWLKKPEISNVNERKFIKIDQPDMS